MCRNVFSSQIAPGKQIRNAERTAHGMCLLLSSIQPEIAFRQLSRIVGEISLNGVELLCATDQMVKTFFLPEPASLFQVQIDFAGSKPFPRSTQIFNFRIAEQTDHQMDMIWHHDKVTQMVPLAIKVEQAIGDNLAEFGVPEDAGTPSLIKVLQILARERFVKLPVSVFREVVLFSRASADRSARCHASSTNPRDQRTSVD
jgi:hypothetical protein